MQHNALHGAEKKDYTKEQDIPTTKSTPPQAASAVSTPDDKLLDSSMSSSNNTTDSSSDLLFSTDDEIIETEYFDIPLPPPTANIASSSSPTFQDLEPDTVVTDPLQYLAYES